MITILFYALAFTLLAFALAVAFSFFLSTIAIKNIKENLYDKSSHKL
jgi:hypothetical protein